MNRDESDQLGQSVTRQDVSRCIDWYAKGEGVVVNANGNQMIVRVVDRKGRRDRLAITAPPGAVFRPLDRDARDETGEHVR